VNQDRLLVLATRNAAKGREMERLLAPVPGGVAVVTLAGYPDAPAAAEDGETFGENALIKARAAARHAGAWAVADDSGLVVDWLGGEPGVRSARYCGRHGDDLANNLLLLERMIGAAVGRRRARFVAAVAVVGPDGREAVVEGECEGQVAFEMRGSGGFGYDCLFLRPELGRTFAELTPAEKDALSHRGRAFAKVRGMLWAMMGVEWRG
jgi:XTP/dITP diphosphohydrolase